MTKHLLLALLLLPACVAATGCGQEPSKAAMEAETPPNPSATAPRDATRLLRFLQRQGGELAEIEAAQLGTLQVVRIYTDYASDELALLEELPALREVMIWRDGERFAQKPLRRAPTDDDLRVLSRLTRVQTLRLGGWSAPFTDAGLAHLVATPSLRRLDLIQAQGITDEGMKHVAAMPALERLNISTTKISDKGLALLLGAPRLERVTYGWAAESARWLAAFRMAHPNPTFSID